MRSARNLRELEQCLEGQPQTYRQSAEASQAAQTPPPPGRSGRAPLGLAMQPRA
jgi:hypothetical protein